MAVVESPDSRPGGDPLTWRLADRYALAAVAASRGALVDRVLSQRADGAWEYTQHLSHFTLRLIALRRLHDLAHVAEAPDGYALIDAVERALQDMSLHESRALAVHLAFRGVDLHQAHAITRVLDPAAVAERWRERRAFKPLALRDLDLAVLGLRAGLSDLEMVLMLRSRPNQHRRGRLMPDPDPQTMGTLAGLRWGRGYGDEPAPPTRPRLQPQTPVPGLDGPRTP